MNPTRKRRLWLALFLLLAAAVAGTLITLALQENLNYLHTPSEAVRGEVPQDAAFRLGGVVREGSVVRTAGTLEVRFAVTDRVADFPVFYSGILPDLFREGQSVLARGRLSDGVFVAEEVLAKHDETYMPKEVADAIAASQAKHQNDTAADGAASEPAATAPADRLPDTNAGGGQ
ncbi:MAG: cytochrome c maturation protein CcmE [Lysobacterales bacterium CG17_big_fil_post_rev_8_21_14_2_50_64_11]|nr:MAG: cytochrome c maturation protein CcmE [Xanthomonadales bacterium CG17_big_fil_post_rev_8_21_14_2_50_64_11]PIX60813.1 MAG: cytochrome c maturation protein CcmE [Xanthomonadales bacterium CG_4_10_14_3_um_filter_64_11]